MAYPVNEIFYSLQGEGRFTGTPAVFVRFAGCNRRCEFCDTDFSASVPMTADEIVAEVEKYPARHVVFTGGEPTLSPHFLRAIEYARTNGFFAVQCATNGVLFAQDPELAKKAKKARKKK